MLYSSRAFLFPLITPIGVRVRFIPLKKRDSPLISATAVEAPRRSDASVERALNVLFVADDPAIAELYRLKLELDLYNVTTAMQGDPIVARAKQMSPDIIFIDVRLPNQGGLEALEDLLADPETSEIAIVLLLNGGRADVVAAGRELDGRAHVIHVDNGAPSVTRTVSDWVARGGTV
jgi:CheY-like chemotaxis protein